MKTYYKALKTAVCALMVLLSTTGFGQGVGINSGGNPPDPSAMLDVQASDKGFLVPRMTAAQRDAISNPANGLQIFNTDTDCLNVWNGSTWRQSCYECDFPQPTVGNNGPLCEGGTLNLTATLVSGATYNWSGPNGFSSTQQNPSISNVTASASGVYALQVTLNGCTGNPVSTTVTINPTPQTPTAGNDGPSCEGGTINLSSSNIVGAVYNWTGPNGYTSNTQNPTLSNVSANQGGTYTVTATVNGCTSAGGSTSVSIPATPAAPTAGNNSPICEGETLNLTASTISGATYSWTGPNGFSSSVQNPSITNAGTNATGTYSVIASISGCPGPAGTTSATVNGSTGGSTQTFSYTGSSQTFIVPNCVFSIHIDARGAYGPAGNVGGSPGLGGRVEADLSVTPGQTLYMFVGGAGTPCPVGPADCAGGWNGGGDARNCWTSQGSGAGGGGASDIRINGTGLTDRILVAGGGGSGGHSGASGGHGGGLTGGNGSTGSCGGAGGYGGTQSAGGNLGCVISNSCNPQPTVGSLGQGGKSNGNTAAGGGGGGGYYGGGGTTHNGGGGGSSYADSGLTSNVSHTQGYQTGNGQIIVSW